jgi:hypothetical protein
LSELRLFRHHRAISREPQVEQLIAPLPVPQPKEEDKEKEKEGEMKEEKEK